VSISRSQTFTYTWVVVASFSAYCYLPILKEQLASRVIEPIPVSFMDPVTFVFLSLEPQWVTATQQVVHLADMRDHVVVETIVRIRLVVVVLVIFGRVLIVLVPTHAGP